jgi:acyl-CoA dehydrogenase
MANGVRFMETMRHFDLADDPVLRDEFAKVYIGYQVAKFTNQRAVDKIRAGQAPGPEMSITKMALCNNMRATTQFISHVLGPRLVADTGEWGTFSWSQFVLSEPAMHIAGGSDEVLRNIVGERVLGLPKEPGIDTTSPFRELRTN